jgi:hypothetical protein
LQEVLPKTDNSVGIDLGIKTFATVGTFSAKSGHETLTRHVCAAFRQENALFVMQSPYTVKKLMHQNH